MMRYQRVSPDCLPLSTGRKSNLRTCKEDESDNGRMTNYNGFEGKALRFRPGSAPSSSQDHHFSPQFTASDSPQSENHSTRARESSPGGDVILQWGHNKRSRGSRAESRVAGDESSVQARQVIKLHRRGASGLEKPASNQTTAMPPPCGTTSYSRGTNLRPALPVREMSGSVISRNLEDRPGPGSRSPSSNGNHRSHPRSVAEKRPPPSPEKTDKSASSSGNQAQEKANGSVARADPMNVESVPQCEPENGTAPEKLNLDLFEWPRIYISLSRKEKEDDFLAMKGTKLPQRPKKRAKNVDKTLQYVFPGMWLSDLTRGRYEVREKKCVKKKRRGLKGMESMDSESE
ncbi:hypothetical protein H6P81_014205 [Aristolochia fimbriata]|uniref:Uncharacterized protein n=1 Tax=Aristolochia fimbriata TaxID=158543 RepID=A0AAV7EKH5_ARIFI|nr:hypothetical protein H6P81_014205 [Aristolochia fimbriata]